MTQKILVLDIDGTLTNSQKNITPATKQAIQTIMAAGHKVIIASGRPTCGVRRYEKELDLSKYDGYVLSFNGGKAEESRTGKILYQRILPAGIVAEMYEFAKSHGCGLITYQDNEIISAFEPDEYILLESRVCTMPIIRPDDFVEYVDFDINKCLLTLDPELAEGYLKELREKYEDIVDIYRSETFYIEIMPKNVNKAASLEKMLEILGQTRENMICCGDSFNDISMVSFAGVGVAMGNAQQALKDVADYVTGTNDNDGLVEVIERFILNA